MVFDYPDCESAGLRPKGRFVAAHCALKLLHNFINAKRAI